MPVKLEIIWENDELIAINKPGGLLSIPDRFDDQKPNAFNIIKKQRDPLFIVHRLDKDTSGILLFAKSENAHKTMNILFENRQVEKIYLALCEGQTNTNPFEINAPIAHSTHDLGKMIIHSKGKASVTLGKIKESFLHFTLFELKPLTGRTHQLRVHMAYITCPIVADPLYGSGEVFSIHKIKPRTRIRLEENEVPLIQRTALHAHSLSFMWNEQEIRLSAQLPKDLEICLKQLRKWNKSQKIDKN